MKELIAAVGWCALLISVNSCVRAVPAESLAPAPEQMPEGRQVCRALCGSYGREYKEYRYDGKCVCKGNDVSQM